MFGHIYVCQNCHDFDACKKCYGRIQTYHGHLKTEDGAPHTFKIRDYTLNEFQDPPEETLPVEEAHGSAGAEGLDGKQGAETAESAGARANGKGDLEISEDDVDDGLNLDDLDNLEDEDDDGSE
jgi:hypothetical protein